MRSFSFTTWLIITTFALFAAGCGPAPITIEPVKKKPSVKKTTTKPIALPTVAADAYPSIDAAMAEVETLSKSSDPDTGMRLLKIETWLNMQGEKSAPDLAARIKDPATGLATRLTACRVLARMGPVAQPTLLEAAAGEPKQLRLKAIESLGRVKPSSKEILDKLLALVDGDDFDTRKAALGAIEDIGTPAKSAVPKLVGILNDVNEDETIRSLAKAALKKVDPRKGLMGAY
jgi:HEAT repeat protein